MADILAWLRSGTQVPNFEERQIAADEIARLKGEVERLTAVNALLETAFPTQSEAKHAEEWLAANPGAPLSDYPNARQDELATLRAENEKLQLNYGRLHILLLTIHDLPNFTTHYGSQLHGEIRAALTAAPAAPEQEKQDG